MLGTLNEKKVLIYFASGLRLNGVDNQAQFQATTNAAIRANVAFYRSTRAAWWRRLRWAMPPGIAGRAGHVFRRLGDGHANNFQKSQDTLYALAADTGGKALLDNNDLGWASCRRRIDWELLHSRLLLRQPGSGRQVPPDQDHLSGDHPPNWIIARVTGPARSSISSPRWIRNGSCKMR
jgi:hypothetical protein